MNVVQEYFMAFAAEKQVRVYGEALLAEHYRLLAQLKECANEPKFLQQVNQYVAKRKKVLEY